LVGLFLAAPASEPKSREPTDDASSSWMTGAVRCGAFSGLFELDGSDWDVNDTTIAFKPFYGSIHNSWRLYLLSEFGGWWSDFRIWGVSGGGDDDGMMSLSLLLSYLLLLLLVMEQLDTPVHMHVDVASV
jgi:hypothetical protein